MERSSLEIFPEDRMEIDHSHKKIWVVDCLNVIATIQRERKEIPLEFKGDFEYFDAILTSMVWHIRDISSNYSDKHHYYFVIKHIPKTGIPDHAFGHFVSRIVQDVFASDENHTFDIIWTSMTRKSRQLLRTLLAHSRTMSKRALIHELRSHDDQGLQIILARLIMGGIEWYEVGCISGDKFRDATSIKNKPTIILKGLETNVSNYPIIPAIMKNVMRLEPDGLEIGPTMMEY